MGKERETVLAWEQAGVAEETGMERGEFRWQSPEAWMFQSFWKGLMVQFVRAGEVVEVLVIW